MATGHPDIRLRFQSEYGDCANVSSVGEKGNKTRLPIPGNCGRRRPRQIGNTAYTRSPWPAPGLRIPRHVDQRSELMSITIPK